MGNRLQFGASSSLTLELWRLQLAPRNPEIECELRLAPRNLLNGAFAWISQDFIGAALILEIDCKAVLFSLTKDLSPNQGVQTRIKPMCTLK